MTDPAFLVARDASLVLLAAVVFLIVFWRLTNTQFSIRYSAKTVTPEPAKADVKRLTAERDEARRVAAELRDGVR